MYNVEIIFKEGFSHDFITKSYNPVLIKHLGHETWLRVCKLGDEQKQDKYANQTAAEYFGATEVYTKIDGRKREHKYKQWYSVDIYRYNVDKDRHWYMMLDRLRSDCEYWLHAGDKCNRHLWAGEPGAQIKEMRRIWRLLPIKPLWLTWEGINIYAKAMGVPAQKR